MTGLLGDRRFGTLFATSDKRVVYAVIDSTGDVAFEERDASEGVASLVADAPAAAWLERDAHDTYGVEFLGEMARPPAAVKGAHEVAVGPIHAGVIESGHFRFHAVGERILRLDVRLAYKHRGLERACEGMALPDGIRYAQRACAACSVSNSVAYAMAAERLMGIEVEPAVALARTALLELERFYNHLHDLSAICAGVGFGAGAMAFAALKERAQRLNADIFRHRFLFDTVAVGASPVWVEAGAGRYATGEIAAIEAEAASAWHEMLFNTSVQDRLDGVGVVSHHEAVRLGAVGPAARAAGVSYDARTSAASGLRYEDYRPVMPAGARGDVAARTAMRQLELAQTAGLLGELLAGGLEPVAFVAGGDGGAGLAAGRVESPRGETICCVEARRGTVSRLHLRTGSYANWPVLAAAVPGNLLPDFPLINKSFELCYACVDR